MRNKWINIYILIILSILFSVFYAYAENKTISLRHPIEVRKPAVCSECHKDDKATLDHNAGFITRHKFYAGQRMEMCNSCHKESFCSDCHANKEDIKPSDKFKDSPERFLPHRGDYLSQHMIDGRINPAPCMKCHGRKNNERCKRCHR